MKERFSVVATGDDVPADLAGAFDSMLPAVMLAEFLSRLAPDAWISVYAWHDDGENSRCVLALRFHGAECWVVGQVVYDYLEVKRRQAVA
jgi:hypothetical protein